MVKRARFGGVSEVTWFVQLGEEKVEGPHHSLQVAQGGQ